MKRLLLLGGGHAHIEVIRRFGLAPPPDTEVTLISADRYTAYSGMLPGLVAGHYGWHTAHIDLEVLCRSARVRRLHDIAVGLDLQRRLVHCADAAEIRYDLVSVDVGSAPSHPAGVRDDRLLLPLRPVQRFLAAWQGLIHEAAERDLEIAIVGGGAGGVELCLAMQYRLQRQAPQRSARFSLFTLSDAILPGQPASVRRRFERVLHERAITLRTHSHVLGVDEGEAVLQGGGRVRADRVVWVTGPAAPRWLGQSGLRTDAEGFVLVDDQLQSVSNPEVLAAGDVATMVNHIRPKSGVFAVRQGPALAENLRLILRDQPPRTYEPQSLALQLISTGERYAVASWGPLSTEGAWVWRWKDAIDRRFVQKYRAG